MPQNAPDHRSSTPLILVHGLLGFDHLTLGGVRIGAYFRQIPEALRAAGFVVPDPPRLNPAGCVEDRARQLQAYLDDPARPELAGRSVHLIAHSMGGLDSRTYISRLGGASRVRSLTTLGTPHHGSPVADTVLSAAEPVLRRFMEHLDIDLNGVIDLSTESCRRLDANLPDAPSVRYRAIGCQFDPPRVLGQPFGILGLTHDLIAAKEGPNDGLVSIASATFDGARPGWQILEPWPVDHFRAVNWGNDLIPTPAELSDNSIVDRYLALAREITTDDTT